MAQILLSVPSRWPSNILTSVFNLLVRSADAFDQRMDAPLRNNIQRTYKGHSAPVFSVATIGDNQFISGSYKTIKLWNTSTSACDLTLEETLAM
jgi:WD40 repeat protein